MQLLTIFAGIVIFVFSAYFITRFLFGLAKARAAPDETSAETALRRTRSFMGFITVACMSLGFWFLYKGMTAVPAVGAWSSKTYYFWAVVIGGGGLLGGLTEYLTLLNSKPCFLCKENVRKDAARCNHCGGVLVE